MGEMNNFLMIKNKENTKKYVCLPMVPTVCDYKVEITQKMKITNTLVLAKNEWLSMAIYFENMMEIILTRA